MLSPSVPDDAASALPPNGLQLLGRVAGHAWQQTRAEGLSDGLRVLLGAGRMLGEREMLAELFAIPAFSQLMAGQPEADALFFISHRYFLSRGFSAADRLACVLDHYRFEQVHFTHDLLLPLHGDGLCLWQHPAGYEIRLRANADTRHEGPLSVALCREAKTLHEISFAWIEAQRLSPGAGRAPVLFATRNQSLPSTSPALARFRTDLPQNSPAYFGLAALNGVACAVGQQRLVGVRDDCQIAYEPCYAEGFRRSYDDFWLGFGGQLLGRHGFEMPVPAAVVPLDGLKAKHRTRARQRREHWREIAESAQAALGPYVIPRKST